MSRRWRALARVALPLGVVLAALLAMAMALRPGAPAISIEFVGHMQMEQPFGTAGAPDG